MAQGDELLAKVGPAVVHEADEAEMPNSESLADISEAIAKYQAAASEVA